MKKLFVHTFGCKVNIYESEVIKDIFLKEGYEIAKSASMADVIVINTCTVTEKADSKFLHLLKKVRSENPSAIIVSVGCFTQLESENEVLKADSDIILGVNNKYDVIEAIREFKGGKFISVPEGKELDYADHELRSFQDHTRAFLKVQDGCDNFCTYCTIKYARGNSRSRKRDSALSDVEYLSQKGFKEIILTGIDLGSYTDGEAYGLFELISDILKYEGFRLRISSVEPWCFDDRLIELFVKEKRICPHFHIPVQSASKRILKMMNRKYSIEVFDSLISKLAQREDVFIATDIIVGFPTEIDEEFEESVKYLESSKINFAHVFSYSDRPFAPSSKLKPKVSQNKIIQRSRILRKVSEAKLHEFYASQIGKEKEIIIEKIVKQADGKFTCSGLSGDYIPVSFETETPYKKGDLAGTTYNNIY
ncbi:TPA: tRNA (N(6)-L-threonylcarbamoyladenosine(37)-C(2))-methylthiotransferase MtaB [Candidatus Delongbacteria bacterium]|nr:MAG: tRNA (N(6)-L-threonylcarbamoyladenosine(37)-C(2))-methylthiotransferase MtaB [Candidatus Delongbacteria bacterium GWF2_40_14]HAQ61662.1 tRNA (N(6)-L-threonylcarbamoyladenosine(37)-C(2))-methylthiotransferase MtaB [Candidatus Delongbacteria bacterium]